MINLCFDLLAFVSSLQTFQIDNFREPLGMPGPGHWLEPHPRGRLEHPWSLRPGTLRAQKPASLHFLCIVSCLFPNAGFKFVCPPRYNFVMASFKLHLSLQLWVSAGRGTLLSELDRLELALPLLLPQEHLPRQARRSHQPHRHRSVHCSEYTRFYTFKSSLIHAFVRNKIDSDICVCLQTTTRTSCRWRRPPGMMLPRSELLLLLSLLLHTQRERRVKTR